MKKIFICGVAALALASCGNLGKNENKENDRNVIPLEEAETRFSSTLTAADTAAVLEMGKNVMELLKAGSPEEAASQLYEIAKEGGVKPLTDENKKKFAERFIQFPVLDYELDYYSFSIPSLNDLKYRYAFAEAPEGGEAPRLGLMFNPVQLDGKWYLTVKTDKQPSKTSTNALDPQTPVQLTGE